MVVRFFIYQTLCCPKNSDQNSDHIFAVNYFLKTGGLNLSIIPKLLLIVDNLFDMLVEEIYAGSSVLGPKVYILSTVKTQMNLSRGLPINRLMGLSRSFSLIGLGFGHLIFWTKYLA